MLNLFGGFYVFSKLITGKSYEYLSNNPLIKYSLGVVIVIVIILCLILILINSFKGISHILNEFFGLDAYKYINVLDIDLEDNFNKLYLPEFIISCIGLASIIGILLYIISEEKAKEAQDAEQKGKDADTKPKEKTTSWVSEVGSIILRATAGAAGAGAGTAMLAG